MAGSPSSSRPFEIIVWGGTGFTGRLVAEHIARNYQSAERPLKWALAGRNAAKLEDVKKSLIAINPDCKGVPLLTANIADAASVDRLLASTKVVVAMAGPYALYGSAIVASAVRQGTHYLDITGETFWVKQLIDLHHEEAARKGVKIVPMCGYESLPSDITTLMAVDHLQKKYGKKTGSVLQAFEHEGIASASGGTIASILNFLQKATLKDQLDVMDPYFLCPPSTRKKGVKPGPLVIGYDKVLARWLSPWLLAGGITQTVNRSAAFRNYGDAFTYQESYATKTLKGALWNTLFTLLAVVCMGLSPIRFLLSPFLPKSGQGPSREHMMNVQWSQTCVARTQEAPGSTPTIILVSISGAQDMGYYMTARMVLEGGIQLARHGDESEKSGCAKGGVLTPATALGLPLVPRLEAAGFKVSLHA